MPYSEFVQTAPYEVAAGRIELAADGRPIRIEPVEPLALAASRRIGVRHFLWRFPSCDDAARAVPVLADFMRRAGLADFVLIESQSNNPQISDKGFAYFAQQELRFDEYMQLVERNLTTSQVAEFRESLADLPEEEDRVAEASDAVWGWRSGAPYTEIGADSAEISHPEKARHWFDEGAQAWIRVHRFGRFVDERLTDQMIIAEIVGESGGSDYRLRSTARTSSPPQMKALAAKVENIFFYNSSWRGAVRDLLNYAERSGPATIELVAFSNEDVLRAIAGLAFGYPGYVPTFRLDVLRGDKRQRFMGLLEWDGTTKLNFDQLLTRHFAGDPFAYFLAVHFGEHRGMNRDIMNDVGVRYAVFREGSNRQPERVHVQGSCIVVETRPIKGSVPTLISENVDEVHKVVEMFMSHDQGFAHTIQEFLNSDIEMTERRLTSNLKGQLRPDTTTYWTGDLDVCNGCGQSFTDLKFMIDAMLSTGAGANLCAKCFFQVGTGLGMGRGQVYEATDKGWLHVAG